MQKACLFIFGFFFSVAALAQEVPVPTPVPTTQCLMPRALPELECEEGGAFVCVNTPKGSVKEDFIIVQGKLTFDNTTLGSFSVSAQHEYTRAIQNIVLVEPIRENCWNQNLTPQNNFCLEENGRFSVYVPLSELGPYTIFLAASRFQGSSMQATVRTSYVVAPTFTPDTVSYEPAIVGGAVLEGTTHVRVSLDLLEGCGETRDACDFVGASTGGVVVSIDNQIQNETSRNIRCETNGIQGAPGRFVIGVPVQPGQNRLSMTVCNAATGFDKARCPKISSPVFNVGGALAKIEILETMPLRFRIAGRTFESCDDSIKVSLNLNPAQRVCSEADGVFQSNLTPTEGYNIVTIEANFPNQRLVETVPFAWERVWDPSQNDGKLHHAVQLSLTKGLFNETLLPKMEHYLNSRRFKTFLQEWGEEVGRAGQEEAVDPLAQEKQTILQNLSYCPRQGEEVSHLRIKMMEPPQIGRIDLKPITFQNQKMMANIQAKDVVLKLQLYKDENGDGRPDIEPLPLKIAFKEVELAPVLEIANHGLGSTVVKLSSPYTDCDYKRSGACFGFPALFTPRKFEGAANEAGAFATCDRSQGVSERMEEICHALNVVDRQTGGVIQEKILDVLNRAYACSGTASLSARLQEGIAIEKTNDLFSLTGKVGASEIKINEQGILASLFTQFGSEEDWNDKRLLIANQSLTLGGLNTESLGIRLFLPVISQLFLGLHSRGGEDFALEIDEAFLESTVSNFSERDFDFDRECGAQEEGEEREEEEERTSPLCPVPSRSPTTENSREENPLCKIRPRAFEILGTPISDYGYLEPMAPLKLTLKPSPVFPLRVAVKNNDPSTLVLELADWILTISSGERDFISAKLSLKITVEVSPPWLGCESLDDFLIQLKVIPEESGIWLVSLEETNTTVIPGNVLLSDLRTKLQFAIDSFSQEGNEIKLKFPRFIDFLPDSFFARIGLNELSWGPEGFDLGWSRETQSLLINLMPHID